MLGGRKACSPGKILIKTVLSGEMWASQTMLLPTEKPAISRLLNQQQQNIIDKVSLRSFYSDVHAM